MASTAPLIQISSKETLFSRLSTSTLQTETCENYLARKTSSLKLNIENNSDSCQKKNFGTFTWPSGACYKGEFSDGRRNGHGTQTWQDGSSYTGEFLNDMRHGNGVHKWSSGEVYEGQFYKDHRHGKGSYSWPDGTNYNGMFYLDRKEGCGSFTFATGDKFVGLYKMDERFGPGILTYKNVSKGQEIGIWHRQQLLKLCIPARHTFSMTDHPEYEYYPEEHCSKLDFSCDYESKIYKVFVRESHSYTFLSSDFKSSLFAENTALPAGIESYSSNFEHLPLTYKHKDEFDQTFFGANYDKMKNDINQEPTALNNTPLMMDIQKHVIKHQSGYHPLSFDFEPIMALNRIKFTSNCGPLEVMSQLLIDMAAEGNERMVYSILKTGLINPNVADSKGNIALIGAATNCHPNVVNLLLDMGANVNQLTDEGICALTACHIFYYPIDHFKPNGPEESVVEHRNLNAPTSDTQIAGKGPLRSYSCEKVEITVNRKPQKSLSSEKDISKVNAETCKSDFRIIKAHRDKVESKKQLIKEKEQKLNEESDDGFFVTKRVPSEQPTFYSNLNAFDLSVDVSDDLINRTAALLSLNKHMVTGVTTRDGQAMALGTTGALAVWKSEHSQLESMIRLLLQRGANPNIGTVPYPALFFAVKAGNVKAVDQLLEKGARTDHRLSDKLFGLGMLHIAAGIRCPEGVHIVSSLLQANADPNLTANDTFVTYEPNKRKTSEGDSSSGYSSERATLLSNVSFWNKVGQPPVEEAGRTALHFACSRDDDYESCRDIVHLLLLHGANPDVNWSGHSPLTLAIASGNDAAVDELLRGGANASLQLTRGVPTALCAASNIHYEHRRKLDQRIKLVDKLIANGADVLAPVQFSSKKLTGSVVDYAHWMFMSDKRVAHTPYHALLPEERSTYTARRTLLAHIGDHLRAAAVKTECARLMQTFRDGNRYPKKPSSGRSKKFLFAGTRPELQVQAPYGLLQKGGRVGSSPSQMGHGLASANPSREFQGVTVSRVSFVPPQQSRHSALGINSALGNEEKDMPENDDVIDPRKMPVRKPMFRYCYDCGRSVGVRLSPCSRCHEVYFCSRACKLKAWEERHKDECLRIKVRAQSSMPTSSEVAAIFAEHSLDETMERARAKTESIVDALLNRQLLQAEENVLLELRRSAYGSRQQSRIATGKSSIRYRGYASSSTSKKAPSSKKSIRDCKGSRGEGSSIRKPAKVTKRTRAKVGKDVEFGTTGMTLAELGITENYSFE